MRLVDLGSRCLFLLILCRYCRREFSRGIVWYRRDTVDCGFQWFHERDGLGIIQIEYFRFGRVEILLTAALLLLQWWWWIYNGLGILFRSGGGRGGAIGMFIGQNGGDAMFPLLLLSCFFHSLFDLLRQDGRFHRHFPSFDFQNTPTRNLSFEGR